MAALELGPQGLSSRLDWREGLPLMVTPRVVLRELRRSDAPALCRVARSPEVARHSWPAPPTVEAFERFIEWSWAERAAGRYTCFGVVPRDSITAAGIFELRPLQPGFFRAELGYFIDKPLWGTGVFHDGARLMVDFAFNAVGVHRIEVRASVENARSNAALQKIGAQKEGLLRAAFVHDGRYEDQYLWSFVNGLDRVSVPRTHSTSASVQAVG
jgi:[ribosomal protein S5]-alanine N-acetyltransferase